VTVHQPNSRKRSKAKTEAIAEGIIATGAACFEVVKAFASGAIVPVLPYGTRDTDLRYAPRFARDLPPDTKGVPYTTGSIVIYLQQLGKDTSVNIGNNRRAPSRWMLLALALLESFEEGFMDKESTILYIREGKEGYTVNALLKTLRRQRKKYKATVAAQNEAVAILSAV